MSVKSGGESNFQGNLRWTPVSPQDKTHDRESAPVFRRGLSWSATSFTMFDHVTNGFKFSVMSYYAAANQDYKEGTD